MTLWLVANEAIGNFCCGDAYNTKSKTCGGRTLGSNEPFQLLPGQFIRDRTTGAKDLETNETVAITRIVSSISTVITTVTVVAKAAPNENNKGIIAVAVGITVPLWVLLLGSVFVATVL